MKSILATALISATAFSLASNQAPSDNAAIPTLSTRQVARSQLSGLEDPVPIKIQPFGEPGCKGKTALQKKNALLGKGYDFQGTASISIDRDITNNEQIDFFWQPPGKKRGLLRFRGGNVTEVGDAADYDDDLDRGVEGRDATVLAKRGNKAL